jgi:hypothetical protein
VQQGADTPAQVHTRRQRFAVLCRRERFPRPAAHARALAHTRHRRQAPAVICRRTPPWPREGATPRRADVRAPLHNALADVQQGADTPALVRTP